MNFWNYFENILDSRNYNPSSLAKIIGIPKTTIYGWQNGASPALDKLIPIADFLEISLDELAGRTPSPHTEQELHLLNMFKKLPDAQNACAEIAER